MPAGVGAPRRAAPEGLAEADGGRAAGETAEAGGETAGVDPVGFLAGAGALPQVFPQASHRCAPGALSTSQDGQTTPS